MRHVIIYEDEVKQIDTIYRNVMLDSYAALFFKEGRILGKRYVREAKKHPEKYFEMCQKMLVEDGWVEEITFLEKKAEVKGSLEIHESTSPTCNRLRGIITVIYEGFKDDLVYCREIQCQSTGEDKCVFEIEYMEV